MEAMLRSSAVYLFLLLVFRIAGKLSLAEVTTFDFVLLLIVAETTQQALLGDDYSVTSAFVLVVTLLALDTLLSVLKRRHPRLDRVLEDTPLVIVREGVPLEDRMLRVRVDEADVMEAARRLQGLERMDQVKYAVLERNGGITVVPRRPQ